VNEYINANRKLWNAWTKIHVASELYDNASFLAGRNSLQPLELEELGQVRGKSLLHLQCHFGQDTLSWARLGAKVTGVDLADEAIGLAQSLAAQLKLEARFLCSDLYDLPQLLDEQFDIVFTSYGVLAWLPDLTRWGQIVAHFLKPGGTFYVAELHPLSITLDDESAEPNLRIRYPYFHTREPMKFEDGCSYADPDGLHAQPFTNYQWNYSLGEVLTALIQAGLRVEFLHEFPFCGYPHLPWMQKSADGWWRLPKGMPEIPFLFSLKATKPA
jgi:2-polyprenyl-3-methyl-5-hydroxy-6-metoxy-1,4-benzoquinol methylase